jgi:hypothetical protein
LECKLVPLLWKAIWRYLRKPLRGIYSNDYILGYDRITCTPMLIRALFIIVKLWKQPRCPITDEWIKKMFSFYYAIKKNEFMLFAGTWIELENFMLIKVSQAQKVKGPMFSLICGR